MSALIGKSVINSSTSKQQYAFSKDARFKMPRQPTAAFGYELPGTFGGKKDGSDGRGFGSS